MGKHEQVGKSDEWYTPRYVFDAMGVRFDLDVAASPFTGTPSCDYCAAGIERNSLESEWREFVWMNPPFGKRNGVVPWLDKFFSHGNGVALVPDRTSAPWWQAFAPIADLILFVSPKIHFIPGPGASASSPAQGTCLLAAGREGVRALRNAHRAGLGVPFMYAP